MNGFSKFSDHTCKNLCACPVAEKGGVIMRKIFNILKFRLDRCLNNPNRYLDESEIHKKNSQSKSQVLMTTIVSGKPGFSWKVHLLPTFTGLTNK